MFAFFYQDEFKGFWANKPGDVFYDLTVNNMNWPGADMVYYPNMPKQFEEASASVDSVTVDGVEYPSEKYVFNGEKLKEC